ncbi:hypothetical protein ABBQ38_003943 [Trebouxia sp. C0009 RCD-2024]
MRRSCRLSTKQEHKLLKNAEASAALAAAAEAAVEVTSVYPSSVTKAIAGLATPSLPSPSMFPEDWRMVEELLHDGQGNDVQAEALCPTKLFANLDAEPTSCANDHCLSARLGSTGPKTLSAPATDEQPGPWQETPTMADFTLEDAMQAPFTFSQLLTHPDAEPGSAMSSQAAFASGLANQDSLPGTGPALAQLGCSLPEDGLDCGTQDAMLWDELEGMGMDLASDPDM